MDEILTKQTTSITTFKANPNREVKLAGDEPFAVLTNNRPSFYVLSPKAYDDLLERMWELSIVPEVMKAQAEGKYYELDPDDIAAGIFPEDLEGD
jgi:PHD/YefM family antitoxin component YafN of YafNO toxin-antitoxin module